MFTRQGGVSPQPWAALNVGGTVGDDPQRVLENRQRTFHALGLELESLYDVWQVHGTQVVCADAPRPAEQAHLRADAILTDRPGVTLFMRFADCVPVFLYDPTRKVIGLVHAGWKGTVQRAAAEAVAVMEAQYGSRADDILAAIGPSIGAHHYEVGAEVSSLVRQVFGADAASCCQSGRMATRTPARHWTCGLPTAWCWRVPACDRWRSLESAPPATWRTGTLTAPRRTDRPLWGGVVPERQPVRWKERELS